MATIDWAFNVRAKEKALNIGIYLYNNAEVLDFAGPYEVFSTANRFLPVNQQHSVLLVAETLLPVVARGGFTVMPNCSINDHPAIDLLVVAGGVHDDELGKPNVISWIAKVARTAPRVSSVCTGAFLLAEAGLLNGHAVTTHWEDCDALQRQYSALSVQTGVRWVQSGIFTTSAGISAGIDMSLKLVEQIYDLSVAQQTARQMEFDWQP